MLVLPAILAADAGGTRMRYSPSRDRLVARDVPCWRRRGSRPPVKYEASGRGSKETLRSPLRELRIASIDHFDFVQDLYEGQKSTSSRPKRTKTFTLYIFCTLTPVFWHFLNFAC
jgi:hypothetical protein